MINEKKLLIRDATYEDLPTIVEIYNSTVPSQMVTADTKPVTVKSKEKWFYQHSPEFRPMWVMEIDNIICGWLSFQSFYGRPAFNSTAEISIYISQNYRKKGLGDIFIKTAIESCPILKTNTLIGFIFSHNKPSLKLFDKYGFENWGVLPKIASFDGIERDLTIVGKRV